MCKFGKQIDDQPRIQRPAVLVSEKNTAEGFLRNLVTQGSLFGFHGTHVAVVRGQLFHRTACTSSNRSSLKRIVASRLAARTSNGRVSVPVARASVMVASACSLCPAAICVSARSRRSDGSLGSSAHALASSAMASVGAVAQIECASWTRAASSRAQTFWKIAGRRKLSSASARP